MLRTGKHPTTGEPITEAERLNATIMLYSLAAQPFVMSWALSKVPQEGMDVPAVEHVDDVAKKAGGAKIPDVEINNPLSKRNIKHIQTRHNVDSIKSQAEYLSDVQLAEKLKDQSFFNSKWTTDEITKYSEIAYNDLLNQGKKGGLFEYSINGEKLNVYIHNDGTFGSVYGNYKYSVQDIRNSMK